MEINNTTFKRHYPKSEFHHEGKSNMIAYITMQTLIREINRCLSPELIRSSRYFWMSTNISSSSPWSSTTACRGSNIKQLTKKLKSQINGQMNLNDGLDNKNVPLTANGEMLSNIFFLYTRVLLQAVEFPVVPFPLSPTTNQVTINNWMNKYLCACVDNTLHSLSL